MERQPVLPRVQRGGGDQSRLPGKGGWLPDDKAGLLAEAGAAEVLRPVEAGGLHCEIGLLPGVIGFMDVFVLRQADVFFRDGMFQLDDALGARVRVRESRKLKHGRDVGLIFGADVAHAVAVGEVVFAVGQLQAALQQVGGIVVGIVEAGRDPQPEKIGGMKVGVVQGVDIGSQALTQGSRQFALVADGGNRFEVRAKRGEALGFDGGFVHVGVVEVGDFANVGTGRGIGFGRFFNQAGGTLVAQVREAGEDADAAAIGRNLGALDPAAVGVLVEIVAGLDRGVHVGHDDAVGILFGRIDRRLLRLSGKKRQSNQNANGGARENTFRGL